MEKKGKEIQNNSRTKKILVIILAVLLLFGAYFFEDATLIFRLIFSVELIIIFYLADLFYDIAFKKIHYLFIGIIALSGILFSNLFFVYPNYDKIQHAIQPIFVCSIMLFMISKLKIRTRWHLTLAFFVTIAILGLFEVGEYGLDKLFDMKLQGVYLRDMQGFEKFNLIMDPLQDTMTDLILGTIGAGAYTLILALLAIKRKPKNLYFQSHN